MKKPSAASKGASPATAAKVAASPSPAAQRNKRSRNKPAAVTVVDAAVDPAAAAAAMNSTVAFAAAAASSSSPLSTSAAAAKKMKKQKTKTTTALAAEKKQQHQQQRNVDATCAASAATTTPPPTHVLVVDNGGETVKYGWSNSNDSAGGPITPHVLQNVTARLPQQWTVLVADQLDSMVSNPHQLIHVTRSMERGMIGNMGNQVQVWKRMLDLLGVAIIPPHSSTTTTTTTTSTVAAKAFGWKPLTTSAAAAAVAAGKKKKLSKSQQPEPASSSVAAVTTTTIIPASSCAILLTVPPHCPRTLLDQIVLVWMEDFGFSHVGLVTGPLVVAQSLFLTTSSTTADAAAAAEEDLQTSCIIDMGWSATHIVPTYRGRPIMAGAAAPFASSSETAVRQQSQDEQQQQQQEWTIRRLPLGGRHLINLWKYYCTYRQYNLMDQDWVLRDVLIQTAFFALDFEHDEMHQARILPAGHRPYDVEYVLPDYVTTFEGRVQQSPQLLYAQQKREEEQTAKQQSQGGGDEDENDDDDEEDEDFVAEENMEEDDDDVDDDGNDDKNGGKQIAVYDKNHKEEEDDDEEEEEEDIDALRKRLLKQRQDEERRRLQEEQDQQVLSVSTERFAIPEVLFRPSDAGLPADWPGLASAIVEAIQACPEYYRAALYRSIHVVGGLSQLTNLQKRLQRELRTLVPCEYEISITMASSSPTNQTWLGAVQKAQNEPYTSWSVSRDEWEAKRGAWSRLLVGQGGSLV
jgi:actin-related protein